MRISDWSSDVCSSDLHAGVLRESAGIDEDAKPRTNSELALADGHDNAAYPAIFFDKRTDWTSNTDIDAAGESGFEHPALKGRTAGHPPATSQTSCHHSATKLHPRFQPPPGAHAHLNRKNVDAGKEVSARVDIGGY